MANNNLLHQGFAGSVEVSTEDSCLHGRILFIDDIVTYEGQTVPELKLNFQAAVARYLAYCKRTGKPANKPYSGTFNVRVGPALHKKAAVAAQAADMNLNEYVSAALNSAIAGEKTASLEHKHHHVITIEDKTVDHGYAGPSSYQLLEKYSAATATPLQ